MILPRAIEAYRNRKLDSYQWVKLVPKEELLNGVPRHDGFRFHTDPWRHQAACFAIGCALPHFLFFLDVGGGKTKLVCDVFHFRRLRDGVKRMLVLVLSDTHYDTWREQVAEHRPELRVVALEGARADRHELILADAEVFLINYEGLMSYLTRLQPGKEGRQVDYDAARVFAQHFDMVVFDEVHQVGNRASLRFRMCAQLSKYIPVRYGLTGSPFGRNPERLFTQFLIVDGGATLGATLGMFRAAFFTAKDNYWGGVDYTFDEREVELLHRMLNHRSIRYKEREIRDVPKVNRVRHTLSFGVDAEEYYARVRDEFQRAKGNLIEQQNSYLRMRQACAGFLSMKDEGTGERSVVPFVTNPKLLELEALVDSLPEWEKVIVFHEFVPAGDAICDMLTRKKVKWARAGGTRSPGRSKLAVRRFKEDQSVRWLVANNSSGATTGINPHMVCRRIVFFDSPDDPVIRKQAEGRLRPALNPKRCYIHDFVIRRSVDETVLGFIAQGESLFQAIVNGKGVRL